MRCRVFLKIYAMLLITVTSYAQIITMEDFLTQLKSVHPFFEKEKLTSQIEQQEMNSYLGSQDWNLFSSINIAHERPAIAFSGPERTDAISLTGGIEKLFWETGGRLSASLMTSRADIEINPLFGFPESFYQNVFAVTYRQPLLKNRNGFLDRLGYELKQFDIDCSDVQALENQEDFLAASAIKFLDWVYLTEQKIIVQERLSLSEEELERTIRKRRANLVDEVEVIRAEDAVRSSKQNQVLVDSRWKALQIELAVLLQNDSLHQLSPQYGIYDVDDQISLEDAVQQLKNNARLLRILRVRLDQLEYSHRGFEEILKPNLSLIAQVNTKRIDENVAKAWLMDKPDIIVGLEFNVPLENRTAKSQITKTDLQISKLKKEFDDLTLALISALSNVVTQIEKLKDVLKLNQEQIASAKERTKEEFKLYSQGRGDLTFVIQSRDNEQNAKLIYVNNALAYHKLMVTYKAIMDELLNEQS